MAGADKRDIIRHMKRLTVRFGIDVPNRVAFTEDISLTGMFIKTPNVCPPNTKIRVILEIGPDTVELDARVMWAKKVPQNLFHLVKKSGIGIRFVQFISGQEHLTSFLQ